LGKLKHFLSIEAAYSKQGSFISQRNYVLDLLKEMGKFGCKPLKEGTDIDRDQIFLSQFWPKLFEQTGAN